MPFSWPNSSILGSYYRLEEKKSCNLVCVWSRERSFSHMMLTFNLSFSHTPSSQPFWRPGFQSKLEIYLQRDSTKLCVIKPNVSETVLRFSSQTKPNDTNSMWLTRKNDWRHSKEPQTLINWVKFCVKLSLSHNIPIEFHLPLTRIIHLPSCMIRGRYYLTTHSTPTPDRMMIGLPSGAMYTHTWNSHLLTQCHKPEISVNQLALNPPMLKPEIHETLYSVSFRFS